MTIFIYFLEITFVIASYLVEWSIDYVNLQYFVTNFRFFIIIIKFKTKDIRKINNFKFININFNN